MHIVVEDILLLHRAERTQTNMEGHITEVHTHSLHLLQQLRRKVKPCRRGSGTAYHAGIHRLIPFPILQFFLDIDKACVACVNRHKEFYGIKEDITPEQDKEILEESKEVYEAIEELKKEE